MGDLVYVDFDDSRGKLTFSKRSGGCAHRRVAGDEDESDKPASSRAAPPSSPASPRRAQPRTGRGDKTEV